MTACVASYSTVASTRVPARVTRETVIFVTCHCNCNVIVVRVIRMPLVVQILKLTPSLYVIRCVARHWRVVITSVKTGVMLDLVPHVH